MNNKMTMEELYETQNSRGHIPTEQSSVDVVVNKINNGFMAFMKDLMSIIVCIPFYLILTFAVIWTFNEPFKIKMLMHINEVITDELMRSTAEQFVEGITEEDSDYIYKLNSYSSYSPETTVVNDYGNTEEDFIIYANGINKFTGKNSNNISVDEQVTLDNSISIHIIRYIDDTIAGFGTHSAEYLGYNSIGDVYRIKGYAQYYYPNYESYLVEVDWCIQFNGDMLQNQCDIYEIYDTEEYLEYIENI